MALSLQGAQSGSGRAKRAVPFLLRLGAKHNGKALTVDWPTGGEGATMLIWPP